MLKTQRITLALKQNHTISIPMKRPMFDLFPDNHYKITMVVLRSNFDDRRYLLTICQQEEDEDISSFSHTNILLGNSVIC